MRTLTYVALLLLTAVVVEAFTLSHVRTTSRPDTFVALSSEEASTSETVSAPEVKCPNCDLCDGSGR